MVYNFLLFVGGVGGLMHGFQWFSRWFCYHKENIDFVLGFELVNWMNDEILDIWYLKNIKDTVAWVVNEDILLFPHLFLFFESHRIKDVKNMMANNN
jgi:hypothetical protein